MTAPNTQQRSESVPPDLRRAWEAYDEETSQPLTEQQLRAVYRRTVAALAEPRRPRVLWPRLALAGAAMTVLFALVALLLPGTPKPWGADGPEARRTGPARVVMRSGAVRMESAGALVPLPHEQSSLPADTHLALGPRARLDVSVGRAVQLSLAGPADVRLPGALPTKLQHGRLVVAVTPGVLPRPFVIRAGRATVTVLGTRFALQVIDNQLAALQVYEGTVHIAGANGANGQPWSGNLEAGQTFAAESGVAQLSDRPLHAAWWTWGQAPDQELGFLVVDSRPAAATVTLDDLAVGETPVLLHLPAGRHQVAVSAEDHVPRSVQVLVESQRIERLQLELQHIQVPMQPSPSGVAHPTGWSAARTALKAGRCDRLEGMVRRLVTVSADRADQARAWMLHAECLLRTRADSRALVRYQHVIAQYGSTPSAENARYERARLLSRLGKPGPALQAFEDYLRRYPAGRLVEPAAFRRCELLIEDHKLDRAQRCLEEYHRSLPHGARIHEVTFLLATVMRVKGRWANAAELYGQYQRARPDGKRHREASYYVAYCLRQGQLPGLAAAIAVYLQLYPDGPHAAELRSWSAP